MNTAPTLTIGTPVFDDLTGLQMLMQSLALYHALGGVELITVDNHPTSQQRGGKTVPSDDTAALMGYCRGLGIKYVPMPEPVGTAAPRNKLFEAATADVVLVCDSHIMLQAGTLDRIREYFADPSHARDIVTGPLIGRTIRKPGSGEYQLTIQATMYADRWRGDMWGTWSQTWSCPCGRWHFEEAEGEAPEAGGLTIVDGKLEQGQSATPAEYFGAVMGRPQHTACPECGRELPRVSHRQHVGALLQEGYRRRCWDEDDTEPFPIPGMGLGVFAMRREHWPGFPEGMKGFGGGELHLHEAVRRNGGRAVCLPGAGWWHRFTRPAGKVPYPLPFWRTIRNYVLWRRKLDMPLEPVHEHFVQRQKKITEEQWQYLIEDPLNRDTVPAKTGQPAVVQINLPPTPPLEAIYAAQCSARNDVNELLPIVRKLAEQCESVTVLSKRPAWDAGIVPARPTRYTHHCSRGEGELQKQLRAAAHRYQHYAFEPRPHLEQLLEAEPEPVDLLLIDTIHRGEHFRRELDRWAPHVKRWIVRTSVGPFGEKGEKGGEGLLTAVESFTAAHPEWHPVFADARQRGILVLSRDPRERDIWQGPGHHLSRIFKSINVYMREDCGCRQRIAQMDAWGAAGCREHFAEIVEALKKDQHKYSWGTQFKAAFGTLKTGLVLKINPLDPLPGFVEEAIRRAEAYDRQFLALTQGAVA